VFGGAVRTAPGQASGGSRWMFAPYSARTRGRAGVGGLCGRCVAAVRAGPQARPAPESERPEGGHGGFAAGAGRRGGGRGGVGGSALVVLLLPCALGAAGDECGLRCRQAPLGGAPVGHHLGVWLLGCPGTVGRGPCGAARAGGGGGAHLSLSLLLPCLVGAAGDECGGARPPVWAAGPSCRCLPFLAGAAGHAGHASVVVSELGRPFDDQPASGPRCVGIVLSPYVRKTDVQRGFRLTSGGWGLPAGAGCAGRRRGRGRRRRS
jgi:hypothetical protein